ncbi:MAG: ATP-binding protein [Myxococcota bacterium]
MMRGLTVRVATAFATALVLGVAAALLVASLLKSDADRDFEALVSGSGLRLLADTLDHAEPERWPAILERVQPHFDHPVRVAASASHPRSAGVPIGETGQFLVLGPTPGPALGLVLWPLLAFVITLVVVAGTLVAVPLAVQLGRTQNAIRQLGEGHWDHRLEAEAEGPLRSLARNVNQTAAQLASLFREREHLLQAVSHELGTPLSRIRFQLALLEPLVPDPARERIRHMRRDLDELDELTSELVGWVEAGAAPHDREIFSVRDVLEPLVELASQHTEHLTSRLDVAPDVRIHGDLRPFQRAMENLLRNAVRYADTTVVVAAHPARAGIVVEVRDDGPGIPEAQRARLLEPFTRVDGARSRRDGGLGLGLAIVHRIVTAHGGTTTLDNAPEGGARVVTWWPAGPG